MTYLHKSLLDSGLGSVGSGDMPDTKASQQEAGDSGLFQQMLMQKMGTSFQSNSKDDDDDDDDDDDAMKMPTVPSVF